MTARRRHGSLLVACALALTLAACAAAPGAKLEPTSSLKPAAIIATPDLTPDARLNRAVDFLRQGLAEHARAELDQLLEDDPGNGIGRGLLRQIDTDPRVLLGEQNYPYQVKKGETLSLLADRFLGDPLLFYALARYNDIAEPDQTPAGRELLIPGVRKITPPQRALPAKTVTAKTIPRSRNGRNSVRASQ